MTATASTPGPALSLLPQISASETSSPAPASSFESALSPPASTPPSSLSPTSVALSPLKKNAYDAKLYIPETVSAFQALTDIGGGELRFASSDEDIVGQIDALLAKEKGKSLDLVLCLDTTETMVGGLDAIKAKLPAALSKRLPDFASFRLGLVSFKDYFEEYLYRRIDFTRDVRTFAASLASLDAGGGRDIPEAVYEGLYAAASEFPWEARTRLVILVGDAPPHPLPRGSIDKDLVTEAVTDAGLELDAVVAPK
jgi:hypothetical protein